MTICAPEIRCRGGLGAGNGVRFRPPSRLAARRGRDGTATGQIRAEDVVGRWEKGQGGSETESSTARPSAASDAQPPAILAMARTRAYRALSRRSATSTRSSSMVSSSRTTQMDGPRGDGGLAANRSALRTPTPASLGSQRSAGGPPSEPCGTRRCHADPMALEGVSFDLLLGFWALQGGVVRRRWFRFRSNAVIAGFRGETARLAGSGMAARQGRGGQKRPQIALDRVTGHARRR